MLVDPGRRTLEEMRTSTLVLAAGLFTACGGLDDTGGCDLPPSGTGDATARLSGDAIDLLTRSSSAQNTFSIDAESGFAPHRLHGVAARPSGGFAVVYADQDAREIHYRDLAASAPEVIAPGGGERSLFFDASGAPLVLMAGSGTYREFRRVDATTWDERTVVDLSVDFPGMGLDSINHFAADVGRDGRLHVFGHTTGATALLLVHGSRDAAEGSDWTFEVLELPGATEVTDYAADSTGRVHLTFHRTMFPCESTCDVALYHAVTGITEPWIVTVVHEGVFSDSGDELSQFATLAIDADDRPVVAAQFQRRVVTGSLRSASVVVWSLIPYDEVFCGEEIVSESDGYAGTDGTSFTGAEPIVEVDDAGRIHVLFADIAAWHGAMGYANTVQGQLRYAVRSGTTLRITTLRSQPGQTASGSPLEGAVMLGLGLEAGGDRGTVVATEFSWDTDSIYNDTDPALALNSFAQRFEL